MSSTAINQMQKEGQGLAPAANDPAHDQHAVKTALEAQELREELQDSVNQVSVDARDDMQKALIGAWVNAADGLSGDGRIENSASATVKANAPGNTKGKDKKKGDISLQLLLLNEQIVNLNAEIAGLNDQIEALNELKDLLRDGELDTNNPEHQALLKRGHVPKDQWDNIDENTIDSMLDNAKHTREQKAEDVRNKQDQLERLEQTGDASTLYGLSSRNQDHVTAELGDDLELANKVDRANGFDGEGQNEALEGFDAKGDNFSGLGSFDGDDDLFADEEYTPTSHAQSLDGDSGLSTAHITGNFNGVAANDPENAPQAPNLDVQLQTAPNANLGIT